MNVLKVVVYSIEMFLSLVITIAITVATCDGKVSPYMGIPTAVIFLTLFIVHTFQLKKEVWKQ
jgi:hypothetical protein